MVRTRSQLENMSEDELIDEVLSLENFKNDINPKLLVLNDSFNNCDSKYVMTICQLRNSLSILRRCNEFLLDCVTHLERNNLSHAQDNQSKTLKPIQDGWREGQKGLLPVFSL